MFYNYDPTQQDDDENLTPEERFRRMLGLPPAQAQPQPDLGAVIQQHLATYPLPNPGNGANTLTSPTAGYNVTPPQGPQPPQMGNSSPTDPNAPETVTTSQQQPFPQRPVPKVNPFAEAIAAAGGFIAPSYAGAINAQPLEQARAVAQMQYEDRQRQFHDAMNESHRRTMNDQRQRAEAFADMFSTPVSRVPITPFGLSRSFSAPTEQPMRLGELKPLTFGIPQVTQSGPHTPRMPMFQHAGGSGGGAQHVAAGTTEHAGTVKEPKPIKLPPLGAPVKATKVKPAPVKTKSGRASHTDTGLIR